MIMHKGAPPEWLFVATNTFADPSDVLSPIDADIAMLYMGITNYVGVSRYLLDPEAELMHLTYTMTMFLQSR